MPGNFKKEDLRIKKTYNALINAIIIMLKQRNFNQITVNDICEEALISRATFYIHFNDKYNLLEYWLLDIKKEIISNIGIYEKIEPIVNQFMNDNQKIIINILKDANAETLKLVQNFISSIVDASIRRTVKKETTCDHIILSTFCTGGLINLLLLQINKRKSSNFNLINEYMYQMLKYIMEWDEKQEMEA